MLVRVSSKLSSARVACPAATTKGTVCIGVRSLKQLNRLLNCKGRRQQPRSTPNRLLHCVKGRNGTVCVPESYETRRQPDVRVRNLLDEAPPIGSSATKFRLSKRGPCVPDCGLWMTVRP